MSTYKIKKLEKIDFHLLMPLVKDCFGTDSNATYFEWKFLDNPAGECIGFIAISESDEVAAYYGVIPSNYVIDGQCKTIYQSCDTMTHSRHRRKGLFQKLAIHCYAYLREIDEMFVIGFSGRQSTPGFLKFGWKQVFLVVHYFYPRVFSYLNFSKPDHGIHDVSNYQLIESSILRSNQDALIHSEKTLDAFKWRLSNPLHSYKVLAIKCELRYSSYLVYYVEDDRIILFDFWFEFPVDGVRLMNQLKGQLRGSDLKGIISFCQANSTFSMQLRKLGFVCNPFVFGPLSDKAPFILYSLPDNMTKFANPRNWLINSFDHDAL